MSNITFTFSGDPKEFNKCLEDMRRNIQRTAKTADGMKAPGGNSSALSGFTAGLSKMIPQLMATEAAFKALTASFDFAVSCIKEAANRQTLEATFVPILKSAGAAQERMKELSDFAAHTPFQLPEIAKASLTLESLTNGALSTGQGLQMVGDVASSLNVPINELSVTVGRLYSGLMSGRAVGEPLSRLQELGAISAETRTKLEDLQKAGEKGKGVWAIAEQDFQRFAGGMEVQSKTLNGALSNLEDNWDGLKAAFGAAFLGDGTERISKLAAAIETLTGFASVAGETLANCVDITLDWAKAVLSFNNSLYKLIGVDFEGFIKRLNGPNLAPNFYRSTDKTKKEFSDITSMSEYHKKLQEINNEISEMKNRKALLSRHSEGNEEARSEINYLTRAIKARENLLGELSGKSYQDRVYENGFREQELRREADAAKDAAKAEEELAKKTEQANKAALDAAQRWQNDSIKYSISKIKNPYEKITAWLNSVGLKSLDAWNREVQKSQDLLNNGGLNIDDAVRFKRLLEVGGIIREINDDIKKLKQTAKEALDEELADIEILKSQLAGDEKRTQELEKQRDLQREIQKLIKAGVAETDANITAKQKIELTYKLKEKEARDKGDKSGKDQSKNIADAFKTRFDAMRQTMTSVASMGNGFGSLIPLINGEGLAASAVTALNEVNSSLRTGNGFLKTIADNSTTRTLNVARFC